MQITNTKILRRVYGFIVIAAGALSTFAALAQQRVPDGAATIFKPDTSKFKQMVPGINSQGLPGSSVGTPMMYAPGQTPSGDKAWIPAAADECSLIGVEAKELGAVRARILDMLGDSADAKLSFMSTEMQIPANCPRKRAAYYLRAIARIQFAK